MRVLVTGFEAFDGMDSNPTHALIRALQNQEVPFPKTMKVEGLLLPVSFSEVFTAFAEKVESFNPDVILSFGLARNRDAVELETVAVNEINADIPDNRGIRPMRQKINSEGPDCFSSTLPLTGFEGVLKQAGIPVKSSQSAGTYVCNYLFYRMMESNQDTFRLCGFIHVPPESILSLPELKRALGVILQYLEY